MPYGARRTYGRRWGNRVGPGAQFYKKRGTKRRYAPRKRAGGGRGTAHHAWELAKTAYAGFKRLRSLVNVEFKDYDKELNVATGTTALVTQVMDIGQGDTAVTREGNSVLLKSIMVNTRITRNPAATTSTVCRLILLIWDDEDVPVVGDVLDGTASFAVDAPLNIVGTQAHRFKILADEKFVLTSGDDVALTSIGNFNMMVHTRWTSGTATAVSMGHPYLIQVSSDGANSPTFTSEMRVRFIDN